VLPEEVIAHLGALVDKSLVHFDDTGAGPARYRLLETVRQYAAQQLEAQGPPAGAARMAHRDHYLALAEAAAPQLGARDQAQWLDRLDLELGNLRAAIAFSLTQADPAPGLRLAATLRGFWKARGHATEAVDALRALLEVPAARGVTLPRGRALACAAYLLEQAGSYTTAEEYCAEALAIARDAGDDYLIADLLEIRAFILLRQGQQDAALPLIEQGLSLARRIGELHLTGRLLSDRSYARDLSGDHADATRDAVQSLRLYRQAGDQLQVGVMLGNLGNAELSTGDLDSARRHLLESLSVARALKDHYGVAYQTFNLGLTEYLRGALSAAEGNFAESLDLARRMGMKAPMAYSLIGLAMAGGRDADMSRSARLHGAASQALAALGHTIEPLEGRLRDLDCQRLRSAMGAESFEVEYAAGRTLTSEQIIDLALGKPA
jgi:predicted ATPase